MQDNREYIIERQIVKLANAIIKRRDIHLKELNLTAGQADSLEFIAGRGNAAITDLKDHLEITQQTASGIVQRMEAKNLVSLRKSKGLSQEELGAQLKVSRQTISKWESAQSYPDFQRLVLLSDYFGLTLDELVKDVDVQEVREKNASSEKIDAIYQDVRTAKRFVKWYLVAGGIAAGVVLALLLYFAVNAVFVW